MKCKTLLKVLALLLCMLMLSAPSVLAQTGICVGDLNLDGEVNGVDTIIYKADYPRSEYLNEPCPPNGPAPVPKTGQTTCYDPLTHNPTPCTGSSTGEDGDEQHGVKWPNPRFTVIYYDVSGQLCPNQTSDCDADPFTDLVQDNLTGLMWTRDGDYINGSGDWNDALVAISYMKSFNTFGYDDWRLPNRFELESLLDLEYIPALSNTTGDGVMVMGMADPWGYVALDDPSYWTSTTYRVNPTKAWSVRFLGGNVDDLDKTYPYGYVWPVRGGHRDHRFTDNEDGTVTDNDTGLIWLENAYCSTINGGGAGLTWDQATTIVNTSLYDGQCGLTDGSSAGEWRLPTKTEWENFVCDQYNDPAVCNTVGTGQWTADRPFTTVQSLSYWSSTEYDSSFVWNVDLIDGIFPYSPKTNHYSVWPVREP